MTRPRERDAKGTSIAWAVGAVVLFGVLFLLTIWLTDSRRVSDREDGLYQFISLGVGIFVSYALGRQSARTTARQMLEPQANAAVRRLVTLAAGMQAMGASMNAHRAFADETAESDTGVVPVTQIALMHELMLIQVEDQIRTATDAIEDWREFVPDEVEAVESHRGIASQGLRHDR